MLWWDTICTYFCLILPYDADLLGVLWGGGGGGKMDGNRGKLRQLPPWMLNAAAADKPVSRLETKDNDENNDVERTVTRGRGVRETVRSVKDLDILPSVVEEESRSRNSSVVTERLAKRSKNKAKRKSEREDADNGNGINGSDSEKERNRVVGRRGRRNGALAPRKKQKANDRMPGPRALDEELTDCEDELTVEDLISIAHEYVDGEQQRLSDIETESNKQLPCTTSSESMLRNHPSDDIPSRNISAASLSTHAGSSRTESSIITSGNSGNPARDMLDVFLGPLLRNLN